MLARSYTAILTIIPNIIHLPFGMHLDFILKTRILSRQFDKSLHRKDLFFHIKGSHGIAFSGLFPSQITYIETYDWTVKFWIDHIVFIGTVATMLKSKSSLPRYHFMPGTLIETISVMTNLLRLVKYSTSKNWLAIAQKNIFVQYIWWYPFFPFRLKFFFIRHTLNTLFKILFLFLWLPECFPKISHTFINSRSFLPMLFLSILKAYIQNLLAQPCSIERSTICNLIEISDFHHFWEKGKCDIYFEIKYFNWVF